MSAKRPCEKPGCRFFAKEGVRFCGRCLQDKLYEHRLERTRREGMTQAEIVRSYKSEGNA